MLARKSVFQIVTSSITSLLGILGLSIIAHAYAPGSFGIIGYITGLIGVFFVTADLGFGQAHIKLLSEHGEEGKANGVLFAIKAVLLSLSLVAMIVFLFLAYRFHWELWTNSVQRHVFFLLGSGLLLDQMTSSLILTFQAKQLVMHYTLPQLIARFGKILLIFFIVHASLNIEILATAYLGESILFFLGTLWFFRKQRVEKPDREMFRQYWHYAFPLLLLVPVSVLGENIDKVFLKNLTDVSQVGYYTSVQGLAVILPLLLSKPIMNMFFPFVSSRSVEGKTQELHEITHLIVRYLSILTIPLIAVLMFFRRDVISLVLGNNYLPAAAILSVSLCTAYVIIIARPYLNLLYGHGLHRSFPKISLFFLLLTVIGYAVLVPILGGVGIALATLLIWLFDGVIKIHMVERLLRIRFYWRIFIHIGAATMGYGVLLLIPRHTSILTYVVSVVLFTIVYGGILLLTKEIGKSDLVFLRKSLNLSEMKKDLQTELQ